MAVRGNVSLTFPLLRAVIIGMIRHPLTASAQALAFVSIFSAFDSAHPALAPAEKPLLPLDAAKGITATWGNRGATQRCELVSGPEFTTDGGSALRISAVSANTTNGGNQYFGMMVPLPAPVDLRALRLILDARTTQPEHTWAFYVRAYNRGESRAAFSFSSRGAVGDTWRTVGLQAAAADDDFAWEPKVVEERVPDRIDRIEFVIGTSAPGKPIDLVVDNLRVGPRQPGIQELAAPRPRIDRTVLVRAGKPLAAVLHPDSPSGRAAAARVVAAVREQTGAILPSRPATAKDGEFDANVILLGSIDSNPAMPLLYARYQIAADATCPGPGGHILQTVHDPFANGASAVVLGASDDAGLAAAAAAFARCVAAEPRGNDLALPRHFERNFTGPSGKKYAWAMREPSGKRLETGLDEGRKALDEGRHTSIAGELARAALRYRLTGHSIEAKLFVALWDLYAGSAQADPRKYGGPWGFDSDFPSSSVVAGWDAMEEDPALTDAERLRVIKAMGRWLTEAVIPKCSGAERSQHVPHNHQTFPALGALFAGLYYGRGLDTTEGHRWLRMADAIFRRQAGYFKPLEDCNGYQWLTTGHLMRYALARPDHAIFENGNGRRLIDYCIGTMNNLGYQVPYGDTGPWKCWSSELPCLESFAFATGDPAATWAAAIKRPLQSAIEPHAFHRAAEGQKPDGFDGVRVWPLEPQYARTLPEEGSPPLERCFDKVSFRESFDPQAAYLLLDGLGNGGHKHLDANAVLQLTRHNRIWLADNDYFKAPVKYHNSVMVFRDGASAPMPSYVELTGAGESKAYGYCRTRVAGYAGADWERAVVWIKASGAFVVLDRLTAREADEYQFRLLWHGVGAAALRSEGLFLTQKGPSLWIQPAPGPEIQLVHDAELGENWKGYPHADPVVHSLAAIAKVRLRAGASHLFATALHGTTNDSAAPWACQYLDGADGVAFATEDGPLRVAFGPARKAGTTPAAVVVSGSRGQVLMGGETAFGQDIDKIPIRPAPTGTAGRIHAPASAIAWERGPLSRGPAFHDGPRTLRLAAARLDSRTNAPPAIVAVADDGTAASFQPDGTPLWEMPLPCQLNDIAAGDIDGDGRDEIILARQDHFVTVLDGAGKERWKRELKYYRRPPHANVVRTGDLNGDGKAEVVVGGENWRFYAFSGDGTELWHYESVHPSRSGAVADLDGDGRAEVICGTHYYWASTLKPDGNPLWKYSLGPICHDVTVARLDPGKTLGVVFGSGDGCLHVADSKGRPLLKHDTGEEIRRVAAGDLDGDGRDEILAGSMNHSVFCFGPDARRRWRIDLGSPVTALTVARAGEQRATACAGSESGILVFLDARGQPLACCNLNAAITDLLPHGAAVVAATADGRIRRIPCPAR